MLRSILVPAAAVWCAAAPAMAVPGLTMQDPAGTTAQQQGNNRSDVEITREIRRAIVKDKSLSVAAHNVTIVTHQGRVTLKGKVKSEQEKQTLESTAAGIAGASNVKDSLTVAQ